MKPALALAVLCTFAVASCSNDLVREPIVVADSTQTAPPDSTTTSPGDSTKKKTPSVDSTKSPADTTKAPADTAKKPPIDTTTKPVPAPADSVSPTGRRPRLIWTPQRQAVWDRMRRENHPLYQVLVKNCQTAVNGSPRYDDFGLWCTILYQVTGDLTYARTAWNQFQSAVTSAPDANQVREYLTEHAIIFDWLYPALSPAERETAVTGLNAWASYALAIGTPTYVGGVRTSDSDASIGYYFGLATVDLATAGLSPQHIAWLSATQNAGWTGGPAVPVGGLDATGTNRQTLRNTIRQYVTGPASGGEWFESSEYNLGTQVLLAMGAAAVRTATGADHFPEVTAYLVDAASAQSYFVTPDLQQSVDWGDVQASRGFLEKMFERTTLLGTLAGETEWNSQGGPQAEGLLQALFSKYGVSGYGSAEPWPRFFLFDDPYAPTTQWSAGTVARYFAGTGDLLVHAGSGLFQARMAARPFVDHEVGYLGDFQLYLNGEWAITHPIGYGGGAQLGQGVNGLLIAGLSGMASRGPDAVQSGDNWWSITGSTSGLYYDLPYWDPPPSFLRMWRRTVVYLRRGGLDIIVVQDTIDADNPATLPSFSRYNAADAATISAAAGLVQWIIHAPVAPAINGPTASWQTPGGQPVSVTTLSPGSYTTAVLSETGVLYPGAFRPSELTGYQLRVIPTFVGGQVVLRHVIVVGPQQGLQVQLDGTTIRIGTTSVTIGATVQVTN